MNPSEMLSQTLRDMGMDAEGYLPKDLKCNRCGKTLNADGNHPAELYAGTYTGLCYDCAKAGPIVLGSLPTGAQEINYPSDWRPLERDTYKAYSDCPDCKGKGFTSHIPHGQVWAIRTQCGACYTRHAAKRHEIAYSQPGPTRLIVVDSTIYEGEYCHCGFTPNIEQHLGNMLNILSEEDFPQSPNSVAKAFEQFVPKGFEYDWELCRQHKEHYAWLEPTVYLVVFSKKRMREWKKEHKDG